MIQISGVVVDANTIKGQLNLNAIEIKIVDKMAVSGTIYEYDSSDHLKFELQLRTNIIASAKALHQSGMAFRIFNKSKCNSAYWVRISNGGFNLKSNVKPSIAITDIFTNGSKYATECSTAMPIVWYKAILDSTHKEFFNKIFPVIYLKNWEKFPPIIFETKWKKYYHNFGSIWQKQNDYFPGDRKYFKNPGVNPKEGWWQGENVIDLGDGTYYGHGMADLKTANQIITFLNMKRKPGATQSAYLQDSADYPDFKHYSTEYITWKQSTVVPKPEKKILKAEMYEALFGRQV